MVEVMQPAARRSVLCLCSASLALGALVGSGVAQTLDKERTHGRPAFTLRQDGALDFGAIWCAPVHDGADLVVSTESAGEILVARLDLDHQRLTTPVVVAGPADTAAGDGIADHKHLFQGGHHYLTFSTKGTGQGGYLYLLKLDRNLARVGLVTVVAGAPPTNDMFLVGDGDRVSVGKFLPGTGHRMYVHDADLNQVRVQDIGGGAHRHANGAAAVFVDGRYHLGAPSTLAPGQNDVVYHLGFDRQWQAVGQRTTILTDPGMITLVTGLDHHPETGGFVVHYTRAPGDQGGDLWRAVFDRDWRLRESALVLPGSFHRPHGVLVGDLFFLGYDVRDLTVRLASFRVRSRP